MNNYSVYLLKYRIKNMLVCLKSFNFINYIFTVKITIYVTIVTYKQISIHTYLFNIMKSFGFIKLIASIA